MQKRVRAVPLILLLTAALPQGCAWSGKNTAPNRLPAARARSIAMSPAEIEDLAKRSKLVYAVKNGVTTLAYDDGDIVYPWDGLNLSFEQLPFTHPSGFPSVDAGDANVRMQTIR